MAIVLTIIGHLLAFVGALTGIIGNTRDDTRRGFRRITRTGWVAAVVAFIGIALSTFQSVDSYRTSKTYEAIVLRDIEQGWRQLLSPWMLVRWEIVNDKGDLRLQTARALLDKDLRKRFDAFDFTKKSRIPEYGNDDLGKLICQMTNRGMGMMDRSVRANTTLVSRDIAVSVDSLRKSRTFVLLLRATCGAVGMKPDYSLLAGAFSADDAHAYLSELLKLGELLGDPGAKYPHDK
jgi:hypothetical protein